MPIEQIADLWGHAGTSVTESVYRHQLRPVLLEHVQKVCTDFDHGVVELVMIVDTGVCEDWGDRLCQSDPHPRRWTVPAGLAVVRHVEEVSRKVA